MQKRKPVPLLISLSHSVGVHESDPSGHGWQHPPARLFAWDGLLCEHIHFEEGGNEHYCIPSCTWT